MLIPSRQLRNLYRIDSRMLTSRYTARVIFVVPYDLKNLRRQYYQRINCSDIKCGAEESKQIKGCQGNQITLIYFLFTAFAFPLLGRHCSNLNGAQNY